MVRVKNSEQKQKPNKKKKLAEFHNYLHIILTMVLLHVSYASTYIIRSAY